jgi:hypothetical protein
MGQIREVDAISDAIAETEKEIAGDAWGNEETSAHDETGNRSLEAIGGGLEGQNELEDEAGSEEHDGDETEGEEAEEGEDGEETEGSEGETGQEGKGETKPESKTGEQREQTQGRVPSGKLREEAERRRLVEQQLETERTARAEDRKSFEALQTQVQTLTQLLSGQRQSPPAAKEETPAKVEVPDIFENPQGFVDHIQNIVREAVAPVRGDMKKQAVETSFALAHATHKDVFGKAFEAINGLNPQNPDDRVTVQRIYNSPNPGEELVKWHKRSTALARFGDDPDAAEARIREETRNALLKDPEFRKQLIADMRGEAVTGENGAPRNTTRLPKSLARAGGSNLGVDRGDHDRFDNSEQSVADAAWR